MEPTIDLLDAVWSAMDEIGSSLGEGDWELPTDCPGWTVRDQFVHMIGTESMLAGKPMPTVDVGERAHVRNDIGRANEAWILAHQDLSNSRVLAAFREVTAARLATLRALTTQEWDAEGFTPEGPGPYRSFMEIRVFDCWLHEQDVREAISRSGGLDGPVADHALGRMRQPMGYVVGKKAAAPQGATVTFSVRGNPPLDFAVAVEGRAQVLDEFVGDPTVALGFDRRSFSRLAAGRRDGAWARAEGAVTVVGDEELGWTIIDNLAYTI